MLPQVSKARFLCLASPTPYSRVPVLSKLTGREVQLSQTVLSATHVCTQKTMLLAGLGESHVLYIHKQVHAEGRGQDNI